jgi:hypothetical protein
MLDEGVLQKDFPHIANTISKIVESKSIPPIHNPVGFVTNKF